MINKGHIFFIFSFIALLFHHLVHAHLSIKRYTNYGTRANSTGRVFVFRCATCIEYGKDKDKMELCDHNGVPYVVLKMQLPVHC